MLQLHEHKWPLLLALSALALFPVFKLYEHRNDACRGALLDMQFARALGLSEQQAEAVEEAGGSVEWYCGFDDDRLILLRRAIAVENENAEGHAKDFHLRFSNDDGVVDPESFQRAINQRHALLQRLGREKRAALGDATSRRWSALGPANIPGRISALAINPFDSNNILLGSAEAGLWISADEGRNWNSSNALPKAPINSIVFARKTPGVVYALLRPPLGIGASKFTPQAIYKSVDAGATWTPLAATVTASNPAQSFLVATSLVMNPVDDDTLIVTNTCAILRSTNGGQTWASVYSNCGAPSPGTRQLTPAYPRFDPNNPEHIVVGAKGGVITSNDGGVTWAATPILDIDAASYVNPAFAASSAGLLYAVSYSPSNSTSNEGLVLKSTNGGTSWQRINTYEAAYSEYTNQLWVDPGNSNLLVFGGIFVMRSTDGGATITRIAGPTFSGFNGSSRPSSMSTPHADQHVIIPAIGYNTNTNRRVFVGNDGGVIMAPDIAAATTSTGWIQRSSNLVTAQYYGIASSAEGGLILAGSQDQGLHTYAGGTAWAAPLSYTDFLRVQIDQTDRSFAYSATPYLSLNRSKDGGYTWQYIANDLPDVGNANFSAPILLNPSNQAQLYVGGRSLWITPDARADKPTWKAIKPPTATASNFVSTIAVDRTNSNIIWVGHNNGEIYFTSDATSVLPTWTKVTSTKATRSVGSILIDATNPQRVLVGYQGNSAGNLIATTDGGQTWSDLTGGLPQTPINKIVQDPAAPNTLFIGTGVGIYESPNGGTSWTTSTDGPDEDLVTDLAVVAGTGDLIAATFSRGAYILRGAMTATPKAATPIRVGSVFSTAQSNARSFLRLYNSSVSEGTATITLSDSTTGQQVAQWVSPVVAPGTSVQYSISEPESTLSVAAKPQFYSVSIQAQFAGHFQHVLWRPSDGTLTNLTTCDKGVTSNATRMTHVHSSRVGNAGYPSSILVHNTLEDREVELNVSDANTGVLLGRYSTSNISTYGEQLIPISAIEAAANITPSPSQFHYTISIASQTSGYLQHLVDNQKAGVVTDMSTVCALDQTASITDPNKLLRLGAVFSVAQGNSQSYLRFTNTGTETGIPVVRLYDPATGLQIGTSNGTQSVAPGASLQVSMADIERSVSRSPDATGKIPNIPSPSYYSVVVYSQFPGTFQHVLYHPADGTLTNLSTCNAGVTTNPTQLTHVHTSRVGNLGFPSSVVAYNTGASSQVVNLAITDALNGNQLGVYTTAALPANGQITVPVSSIENALKLKPTEVQFHYTVTAQSPFKGFLQHLVENQRAGVITDMTTVCTMPLSGP